MSTVLQGAPYQQEAPAKKTESSKPPRKPIIFHLGGRLVSLHLYDVLGLLFLVVTVVTFTVTAANVLSSELNQRGWLIFAGWVAAVVLGVYLRRVGQRHEHVNIIAARRNVSPEKVRTRDLSEPYYAGCYLLVGSGIFLLIRPSFGIDLQPYAWVVGPMIVLGLIVFAWLWGFRVIKPDAEAS